MTIEQARALFTAQTTLPRVTASRIGLPGDMVYDFRVNGRGYVFVVGTRRIEISNHNALLRADWYRVER